MTGSDSKEVDEGVVEGKLQLTEHDLKVIELHDKLSIRLDELPVEEQTRLEQISLQMIGEVRAICEYEGSEFLRKFGFIQPKCSLNIEVDRNLDRQMVQPVIANNQVHFNVKLKDLRDVSTTREELMHVMYMMQLHGLKNREGELIPGDKVLFNYFEQMQHLEIVLDVFLTIAFRNLNPQIEIQDPVFDINKRNYATSLVGTLVNRRLLMNTDVFDKEYLDFVFDFVTGILEVYQTFEPANQLFELMNFQFGLLKKSENLTSRDRFVSILLKEKFETTELDYILQLHRLSQQELISEIEKVYPTITKSDLQEELFQLHSELVKDSNDVLDFMDLIFMIFDANDAEGAIQNAERVIEGMNNKGILSQLAFATSAWNYSVSSRSYGIMKEYALAYQKSASVQNALEIFHTQSNDILQLSLEHLWLLQNTFWGMPFYLKLDRDFDEEMEEEF